MFLDALDNSSLSLNDFGHRKFLAAATIFGSLAKTVIGFIGAYSLLASFEFHLNANTF